VRGPRRKGRRGRQMTRRVAAIDCGTNSLRLLIADADPAGHRLVDVQRRMEIVRLGQGVDATGVLAPDALARTFRVLAEYAREIRDAGAARVRMVATSATRDARNAADFTGGVRETLGITPEVVTGGEEALLSFAGATTELAAPGADPAARAGAAPEPPYLVVDIGGGSTEFVLGGSHDADLASAASGLAAISVDIGCVRLTERHLRSDPPSDAEIKGATADVDRALDTVAATIPVADARTLVGLAGSVTTVAAIALGLQEYDPGRTHHARISADAVHAVTAELLAATRRERAGIGSMHPGRVDVIGAGALVLDEVMRRFGFAELVTSEHDILDGIAWSIAGD
jgi:exopolyphosphatase / guanosine-5'-triphosphate,3'-diphosphate pyrophosphatase